MKLTKTFQVMDWKPILGGPTGIDSWNLEVLTPDSDASGRVFDPSLPVKFGRPKWNERNEWNLSTESDLLMVMRSLVEAARLVKSGSTWWWHKSWFMTLSVQHFGKNAILCGTFGATLRSCAVLKHDGDPVRYLWCNVAILCGTCSATLHSQLRVSRNPKYF